MQVVLPKAAVLRGQPGPVEQNPWAVPVRSALVPEEPEAQEACPRS